MLSFFSPSSFLKSQISNIHTLKELLAGSPEYPYVLTTIDYFWLLLVAFVTGFRSEELGFSQQRGCLSGYSLSEYKSRTVNQLSLVFSPRQGTKFGALVFFSVSLSPGVCSILDSVKILGSWVPIYSSEPLMI